METFDVTKRKELRKELLEEVYKFHFESGAKELIVTEELYTGERKLAYRYLRDKELLDQTYGTVSHEKGAKFMITVQGIDFVESGSDF